MSEEKRLHPITAVMNALKTLKEAFIPIVILVFLNRGEAESILDYLPFFIMGGMIILFIFLGVIKWWRFKYWIEEGELRIEQGLFVKKKRYIPFERIQSLNYTEGVLHRPLKLVKIKVETAGSSSNLDSEAELTAITKPEADELNRIISAAKKKLKEEGTVEGEEVVEPQPEEHILYKMSPKDLIVMATTSGGAGVVIGGILIFLSQFGEVIPYEAVFTELVEFVEAGFLLAGMIAVLVFFIAWLIAVGLTFLRYAHFTVKLVEKDIVITRGLLEKKQTTVPLKRIQGITFDQNVMREPFGYTSVTIESAGGSVLEKDSNAIRLLPMIREKETYAILNRILPDYHWKTEFTGVPKRALKRYIFWKMLFSLVIIGPVTYFFFPLGLLSLILIPLAAILGWWQYKTAGWSASRDQLTLKFRGISKQIVYMKKKRIQSLEWTQTYFQRRGDVATIHSTIKSYTSGSHSSIPHISKEDAELMMDWYSPEAEVKKVHEPLMNETELEGY
ncbi:PH domain-containing protein [Jeotgalibacillus haloalkalitolerans]|uniref:PH domain-containing protein n=1 Tax=Jeotgalibacillus haloalkalitolerans TaxID=3104292 RepID=A0ABU5KPG9_9BACL|nr:PH domain-containing protein [Jeotgalibacillus sp. HH7-29]MDZ5713157.1 PH domain-containing protein [Jeotgalibacillus sp. HH7-29]